MSVQEKMTAIADAIRGKTGDTGTLTLDQMAQEIAGLEVGGGSSYDFDVMGVITRTIETLDSTVLTEVGNSAFRQCDNLVSVNLPNATYLGGDAFANCDSLETVNFPKVVTAETHVLYYDISLQSINFPVLQSVPGYFCYGDTGLTKADFGGATSVAASAFYNCKKMDVFILRASTVATLANKSAFTYTPIASGTGYIYVPASLVDSYKAATNWSNFADQFRAIEDYPDICG